jgi:hypothetical protein
MEEAVLRETVNFGEGKQQPKIFPLGENQGNKYIALFLSPLFHGV